MCRGPTAVDPPHPQPANIGIWGSRIGAYGRNRLDEPAASRVGSPRSLGLVAGGLAQGDGLAGVARGLGCRLGERALEAAPLVVTLHVTRYEVPLATDALKNLGGRVSTSPEGEVVEPLRGVDVKGFSPTVPTWLG